MVLVLVLGLSWLWFWTVLSRPGKTGAVPRASGSEDAITVWISEHVGSSDEAYWYELAELWNQTNPDVHLRMAVISHAGYESKLRIAVASGQPPDVSLGGLQTLESLQYSGKADDLAVPIPEDILPMKEVEAMGPLASRAILRDGHPTVFPVWRYAYGGVLLANRTMLKQAGFDDERIRREGWTFDQFREACRRMTRDTDGNGTTDAWGFGAALVHLDHLFLNEFGPGVWGKEITHRQFLGQDANGRWTLHLDLTEEQIYQVLLLFHQLINVDKSWCPATLGMDFQQINDEVIDRRRLGMTFGETPWVVRLWMDIWNREHAQDATNASPPDLTVVWMPTLKAGDRPVPRAGVYGLSVMRQTPHKGQTHTTNALRVARFLTHPVHLVRSQLREFRHLPPDSRRFGTIFPELLHSEDPGVQFYNEVMDSDTPVVSEPLSTSDPNAAQYAVLGALLDQWLHKEGSRIIQEVVYQRLTPREGAKQFMEGLRHVVANPGESTNSS
jgi:hypothetical protein